jgi:hypothetical protein
MRPVLVVVHHVSRQHRLQMSPAGVDQAVAVGWAAAEEAPLDGGLCTHGGAHAGLDAHALALRLAAEQGHGQVVRLGAGVDGAADLGDPQLHAEVLEDRVRVAAALNLPSRAVPEFILQLGHRAPERREMRPRRLDQPSLDELLYWERYP